MSKWQRFGHTSVTVAPQSIKLAIKYNETYNSGTRRTKCFYLEDNGNVDIKTALNNAMLPEKF